MAFNDWLALILYEPGIFTGRNFFRQSIFLAGRMGGVDQFIL
jgi:hypothetical protein